MTGRIFGTMRLLAAGACSLATAMAPGDGPMASSFRRGNRWLAKFKDALGVWRSVPTDAASREGALAIARGLEGSTIRNGRDWAEKGLGLPGKTRDARITQDASNPVAMVTQWVDHPGEPGASLASEAMPRMDTLGDLMAWWLKEFSDGSRSAQPNRSRTTHHILKEPIGQTPLKDVTPQLLERWLHEKGGCRPTVMHGRRMVPGKMGSSAATLNHLRISISVAFNRAIEHGLWSGDNPAKRVKKRKQPKKTDHQWLREDEVKPMLEAIEPRFRNIAAAAVYTGGRKGEVCSLLRSDIDLDAMTVHFARSWEWDSTKGGHDRHVPIVPDLEPFIREQLRVTEGKELLFPAADGGMLRRDFRLEKFLRKALAAAGIDRPRIRWHDLRHTTGSVLINRGVPIHVVQRVLGHSSVSVTEKIYAHLLTKTIRDEMVRGFAGTKGQAA